jgi:hypothetical protein
MTLFFKILFVPFMCFFNIIGGLCCVVQVGFINGYVFVLEQLEKASEK